MLMKYTTRSAMRRAHKLVLKEELLPEEQAEQQYLRRAMSVLYQRNYRPFWRRGSIMWYKDDKQGIMTVMDIRDGLSDDDIAAVAEAITARAPSRPRRMETTRVENVNGATSGALL